MGFVYKLAFDAYGQYARSWTRDTNSSNLKARDIIRINGDSHNIFITNVDANGTVTYADCNRTDGGRAPQNACRIYWDTVVMKQAISVTYVHHSPYALAATVITEEVADIPNGSYSILHRTSNRFVVTGNNRENGVQAFLYDWCDSDDQRYTIEKLPDGTYRFKNKWSGRMLDVSGQSIAPGTDVVQWDWYNGDNQHWLITDYGKGWYKIFAKHSGLVMSTANGSNANGARIVQSASISGNSQLFRLLPQFLPENSANIPNGVYGIRHKGSGKHVVMGNDRSDGVQAFLFEWGGSDDQRFFLERLSDNSYSLKNVYSGRYLDVYGETLNQGEKIVQWEWYDGDNQHWFIIDRGDGWYQFIAKHSCQALDVAGNNYASGTKIIQWGDYGGESQLFNLTPQEI